MRRRRFLARLSCLNGTLFTEFCFQRLLFSELCSRRLLFLELCSRRFSSLYGTLFTKHWSRRLLSLELCSRRLLFLELCFQRLLFPEICSGQLLFPELCSRRLLLSWCHVWGQTFRSTIPITVIDGLPEIIWTGALSASTRGAWTAKVPNDPHTLPSAPSPRECRFSKIDIIHFLK